MPRLGAGRPKPAIAYVLPIATVRGATAWKPSVQFLARCCPHHQMCFEIMTILYTQALDDSLAPTS
jgi:hypothetical protein